MKRLHYISLCGLIVAALFWRVTLMAQAEDGTLRRVRVPILMYHYTGPLPEDADDIRTDLTIEPDTLRTHLQYLVEQGYTTITLDDLYAALTQGTPLPPRPVILTFDDGYVNHYEYAFPLLQEYGLTGTFFVITGRADNGDPAYLSWEQIRTMAEAGMQMQIHTRNHFNLSERDWDFLIYEMLGSRESLEAHTGLSATMLAYPAGRYDDQTLHVAQQIGVQLAVTTQPGMDHASNALLELPRVRVHGGTSAAGLAYLLAGRWLEEQKSSPVVTDEP